MRALLEGPFRGPLERSKKRCRLTMQQRLALYSQGELLAEQVWGLRPQEVRNSRYEPPEMLDAAGLIVSAVFLAMPTSVTDYLKAHPNRRTQHGGYRPIDRYETDHDRKHWLCITFRNYHRRKRPRDSNRREHEPLHEYLDMTLVAMAVRQLLGEFRDRSGRFVDPFPVFVTSEADYVGWEIAAIRGVQEMLEVEKEALQQPP